MTNQQNPQEKNQKKIDDFGARTKKFVFDNIKKQVSEALLQMWESDINAYDINYVENRALKILEEKFKDIDFKDKKIVELRMKRFNEAIDKAKKAKTKLNEDKDKETQKRNERCEPVCQKVVEMLLDSELLMSDPQYFSEAIEYDDELLSQNRIRSFMDGLFERVAFSINESFVRANKKLWGVYKEDVTMKQIDNILKSK